MNRTRVYHPGPLALHAQIELDGAVGHHLTRVLRIGTASELVVFNGQGGEYRASVQAATRGAASVRLDRFDDVERESPLDVTLAQVVSAGERMDLTVQKAVELGVARIQPLSAARTKVHLAGDRAERRVAHWQRIAVSACEQCGRNRVPPVAPMANLGDWLSANAIPTVRLMLAPDATRPLSDLSKPADPLALLVGAESGLTEAEERAATQRGFMAIRLGPRVLRTETAALAALAAMQALWGDM